MEEFNHMVKDGNVFPFAIHMRYVNPVLKVENNIEKSVAL